MNIPLLNLCAASLLLTVSLNSALAQVPPAHDCVPPPAGLVDWWPFDETLGPGGIVAQDIAGALNNASLPFSLGPTPVAGVVSNALSFDGVDDFLEVPDHPEINFAGACGLPGVEDFTIDLWVKFDTLNAVLPILDKRDVSTIGGQICARGYALAIQNGRLLFQMADGAGSPCQTTYAASNALAAGVWHFVAVSVPRCQAAGGGFIYVNGKIDGVIFPRTGSIENTNSLFIGRSAVAGATGFAYFDGCMDELEFFKRALSKAELDAIYQAGSAGKCKTQNCIRMDCPPQITATTSSNCAPVNFSVTATNPCCNKVLVTCFPPSGSLFGLGTTLVTCTVADVCGSRKTCLFPVTVSPDPAACQPPAITVHPQQTAAPQGSTALLSVTATGTAPLAYQWRRSGTNLSGQTSATLTLPNVQRSQAGGYSVCVSNACGVVTSLVAQVVVGRPAVPDVKLTADVSSATPVGANVMYTFTLENIGAAPAVGLVLTGYWASAQAALQGGSAGCVFSSPPNAVTMTCNVGSLAVGAMTNYTVVLQSFAPGGVGFNGSVGGDPSELNLANNAVANATGFGFPPSIVTQPVSVTGFPGGAGGFSVVAAGTPPLSYSWKRDGIDVGPNGPALNFTELKSSDGGNYEVIVSNPWGQTVSVPVTLTLSFPATPTATIDVSQTLHVTGSAGVDDLEVRLAAGDPTTLEIDNLATTGTEFAAPVSSFNRLVINLGDQNNKLVFNDANGRVTALNKRFEIYGGTGSNLVVASSSGIDLSQLPALLGTLNAAPNFEALAQGLYDQANTNLLTPSIDLVGRLYSNMVQTAQMLAGMAQTNIAADASNLVAQAQALSQVASNCANEAVCKFADPSLATAFRPDEFTNCLFQLIARLEALEDTLPGSTNSSSLTGAEQQAENISDQMEALIEGFEESAANFELGMDDIFDTGADAFYGKIAMGVEGPGNTLGEIDGPNFEALGEAFAALAEQLLEAQSALVEAESEAMTTNAMNLEAAAEAVAQQAASLEQALETFTAAADPPPGPFFAASGPPTGTNAGCDRDISASNSIVIIIGGIIIGTPTNDTINALPSTILILGLGGDDLIFGNTNFNIIFGGKGNDEIHGLDGVDLLFGGKDHDCIFGDGRFDLLFGGDGDDNLHGGTNIDLVIGWKGDDKLFGDENIDLLLGWDGDDTMDGGDHIDVMFGNKGNDTMEGGPGYKITNDIPFVCKFEIGNLMFGGPDDDTMNGCDGLDVIFGLAGNDTINASNQVDVLFGNAGDDTITAGDGGALFYIIPTPGVTNGIRLGAVVFGGPDNDTIEGGNDIDVLFGGGGNDNIRGSYSYDIWDYPNIAFDCGIVDISLDIDVIFGRDGDDTLDGGHDTDVIFGGNGNDIVLGNGETNQIAFPEIGLLFGGRDNDTVVGGTNDILTLAFGGRGDDTIQGSQTGVMNLLFGSQDQDTIEGYGDIITLAFGGADNDTVNGGGYVIDLLFGGTGADIMHGRVGVLDLMFGNTGDDDMNGGTSVLKLMFGNRENDTMDSGFGALGLMFGNRGCDTMTNRALVGLAFGNQEEDSIYGSPSLVEIFFGNDHNDYVEGGGLIDILFGNAGRDTMQAGPVLSLVFGNKDNDTLRGSGVLDLLFSNDGVDRIQGNGGPDLIFGGKDGDKIQGGTWPDLIFGGSGEDVIYGEDGVDLVFGGTDKDFLYGGSDTDLMFGGAGTFDDTIDGGLWKDIIFGQKGNDTLDGGGETDRIWGGQDNDNLVARGDDTRLRGNRGDDLFWVNGGNCVRIHGGPGSDTYDVASGGTCVTTSVSQGSVGFGIAVPHCAEIYGYKWRDLNGNGIRDPGEPGIAGVTITLNNGAAGSTVTMPDDPNTKEDETGKYCFMMLAPGTYLIREVLPAGYQQTFPSGNAGHTVSVGPIDIVTGKDFGNRPCVVAPTGLVMWLPLDEPISSVWAYNRAGGLNGRYGGMPPVASGLVDSSRCFNEVVVQSITVLSHGLIEVGTNDFSLDAWVRRSSGSPATQMIFDKRQTNGAGTFGYSLYLQSDRLWCRLADGTVSDFDSGLTVPADGQWHFVAVAVQRNSATGGRFHVDGATSTFNPTARNGSLAHTRLMTIAVNCFGPTQPFFGCLDELEMFARALTASELTDIYNARAVGKCKLKCHLPAVVPFCGNQQTVTITAQICNYGATADTFNYSFLGLPPGPGCDVAGPTTFNPASGSVVLGPGSCTNIPVTITRPSGMAGTGPTTLVACYQMAVTAAESGRAIACVAKVSRPANSLCVTLPANIASIVPVYITADRAPVLPNVGKTATVEATFRNESATPLNFTARFSFAANEDAPQPAFAQPVSVPPGGASSIPLQVSFTDDDDPAAIYTIFIEADLDGDGEFEPLNSFAVREVVQARMDTGPLAGISARQLLHVSWSGFGTLESAPTVLGPWNSVPGNPGSPLLITNPVDRVQVFRLKQ